MWEILNWAREYRLREYDLCTIVNLMTMLYFDLFMDGVIRTVLPKIVT